MNKVLSWKVPVRGLLTRTILIVFLLTILASKTMGQTTWNGGFSNDWFAGSNWSSGVPTAATNVTIPSGVPNFPDINGTGAVCNNLTINSGASLTISGVNELTISGDFSNNGTFDAGASTVIFNGAAQTVPAVLFHHLVLAGSGIKTITGLDTVGGNFIMDGDNTTFVATTTKPVGPVFCIGGDMIINAGNTFLATNGSPTLNVHGNTSISGIVASPGGGKNFYGDFTINAGGKWTENGGGPSYSMYGNVTNNGTFDLISTSISMRMIGSGKTFNGSISVGTLSMLDGSSYTNTGNLAVRIINNPGTLIQDEEAVLTIGNNITNNTILTATATGNVVNYTGTTDQTVKASEYYHLNLGGSGTTKFFTSASYTVDGNLTVAAGTTMEASPGIAVALKGNLTNNGVFTASTSTVSFTGSTVQTIDGTSATSVNNLTLDNSAGLSLSQDLTVGGTLTFNNGIITSTASNLLTFSDGSAASGSGPGKYIDGPARKVGNSGFTFPVGKSGIYAPLSISAPAVSTDAFTAEYIRSAANALGSISAPGLVAVSACEYWRLDRDIGTSNVNVTLSWSASSPCNSTSYIGDPSSIVVAHFDGSVWNGSGNDGGMTGDAVDGTVTWNNVSEFSPFTIGTTSTFNPLPLKFGSVKTSYKNNGVQVDWTVFTEADVEHYEIERSSNGQSFVTVGLKEANNSQQAVYTWFDALPPAGNIYYRIKSVDVNGNLNYSAIVRINLDASIPGLLFYPNPAVDKRISFQAGNLAKGQYQLIVTDIKGAVVYKETFTHAGGAISQSLQLPASVTTGVYTFHIKSKSGALTRTFIVR